MRLIKVTRTNNDLMVHFGHPNAATHVITAGEAMVLVVELRDALEAEGIPVLRSSREPTPRRFGPVPRVVRENDEHLGVRA